jgi:hypothetical protein
MHYRELRSLKEKELIKRGHTSSQIQIQRFCNGIEDVQIQNVKLGKAQIGTNQTIEAYAIAVFDKNKPVTRL